MIEYELYDQYGPLNTFKNLDDVCEFMNSHKWVLNPDEEKTEVAEYRVVELTYERESEHIYLLVSEKEIY